jgi:hypothetical protein
MNLYRISLYFFYYLDFSEEVIRIKDFSKISGKYVAESGESPMLRLEAQTLLATTNIYKVPIKEKQEMCR